MLILAATNAPWHVDPAFRRPGAVRSHPVRAAARRGRAGRHPAVCSGKAGRWARSTTSTLAKKTDQFSGADLKAVVDLAVEAKLREAMKTGRPGPC